MKYKWIRLPDEDGDFRWRLEESGNRKLNISISKLPVSDDLMDQFAEVIGEDLARQIAKKQGRLFIKNAWISKKWTGTFPDEFYGKKNS